MEEHKVSALVIVDHENKPTGVIHLHDILKAGVA
jgi:arabinose-5-phosphate isomerase